MSAARGDRANGAMTAEKAAEVKAILRRKEEEVKEMLAPDKDMRGEPSKGSRSRL